MWVKQYLNMGPHQPKWAYLMDEILRMERPKHAKETYQKIANWNPLMQSWKLKAQSVNILLQVQTALRLARTHKVELKTLEPAEEIWREMPVWLHRKVSPEAVWIYKTNTTKCLKSKHCTHYIEQLATMLQRVPDEHQRTNFCTCPSYTDAAKLGYTHPQQCLETAEYASPEMETD